MKELIELLEEAAEPTQALFANCYYAIFKDDHKDIEQWHKNFERWGRFSKMLDAQAWESAAMMLLPEGKDWHIEMCDGCALAAIGERIDVAFECHKIPAHALIIAILKRGTQQ